MIERELIDACTHCGFCLPTCPTYGPLGQMEADSPRGRIWLMKGLADGTMTANSAVVEHIDRCLGCMACVTACPSGVRYDLLIEQTREVVEEQYDRPAGDWLLRSLVFSVFPHRRRLRAALAVAPPAGMPLPKSLRALAELAPPWRSHERPPELTPAAAASAAASACSPAACRASCSATSTWPRLACWRRRASRSLRPANQACCGALHLHAGKREEGRRRAQALGERFRTAGVDAIAVNAAGCGSHLKEAGLDVRVADVSELLAEEPRAERQPLALRVAFQDSCHLAHAQGIRVEPRDLIDSIPGLVRLEPAEQAICCGSAGIYNLTQPDAARALGDRKAGHVLATEPNAYASANPGCLVQVSAALRRAGRPLPALHPIELLDASILGLTRDQVLATARR